MKLYTYFRSSAAYRVRIALNLKGLNWDAMPVHLVRDGGQQNHADYKRLNPAGLVPCLETDDGHILTQSLAIIEYLDETCRTVPLLPADALQRAQVRALAYAVACDIHPINNLRVLRYLGDVLDIDAAPKAAWYRHWVELGLGTIEKMLNAHPDKGRFCHGDTPGMADCCLIPQVYNARRFNVNLDAMPIIRSIAETCESMPAFHAAAPENCPDAE